MARLEGGREAWGAVDHPETGELIQLDEDHPREVAEAVASAYEWLSVVDDGSDEAEDESPVCGVNGCSRGVDSPPDKCWQHSD